MSVVSDVRDYIASYAGLETDAPVWVDFLGPEPIQYSIVPTPGPSVLERYLNGASLRQFTFAVQSVEATEDDFDRLATSGFYEALSDWFESQTEAGALPDLGSGKKAVQLEATGWAFLFARGESQTGIYQIQARLVYEQDPL
jgi:hypothetical protein